MSTPRTVDESYAVQVLHDLVSVPSVSGSEHDAAGLFIEHATALGFDSHIDSAGNAVARLCGRGLTRKCIALLGHIDTVRGHIPVRIENGILYGRGAVDAKGPLCAMLLGAASCGAPDGVEILVMGAIGEETIESPGARYLRDQFRPDACIIAEPSAWDAVTLGYKGRLVITATRRQDCSHSAGPDLSPSDVLLEWWRSVIDLIDTVNVGRQRVFDRVQATITAMRSDTDGHESYAQLQAGFRLPEHVKPDLIEQRLRLSASELGIDIEAAGHELAHATHRTDPVVRALSAAIRSEGGTPRHKLKTGTADLNVVAPAWRCPIAAYGPGDSSLDHTPREHISVDEYLRSIRVLAHAIRMIADDLIQDTQTTALHSAADHVDGSA